MFGRSDDRTKSPDPREAASQRVVAPEPSRAEPQLRDPAPVVTPPVESKASGEVSAYFGKGSKISGKLNFEGTVRVDGRVDGEIHAKDTLVIGDSAEVMAEIHATSIVVRGVVRGDIHATRKVEIRAPGKLYGNISSPAVVIEEGVIFEGSCTMENLGAKTQAQVKPLGRKEEGPGTERVQQSKEPKENVG
jgi:cytoskeletal protein CcmA (bactofilin family)